RRLRGLARSAPDDRPGHGPEFIILYRAAGADSLADADAEYAEDEDFADVGEDAAVVPDGGQPTQN
ncbi:MAG: hypothetical protein L0H93_06800, partial [Nocardioides sp.]|nr:hypothetical protein [Nocardioides sp.]